MGRQRLWNPRRTFPPNSTRVAKLAEAIEIIRRYFVDDVVDFDGKYYRVRSMEALPRCVQRPGPPVMIGAGSPRVRQAACAAGREAPRIQFSCLYVHVTDSDDGAGPERTKWSAAIEDHMDVLKGSPAVLVGSAARCAERILEWHERFGISVWHLGGHTEAVSRIIQRLRRMKAA